MKFMIRAAMLVVIPAVMPAQSGQVTALRCATVHTGTGRSISGATVVIRGGRIVAVGDAVAIPRGARVIGLCGQHVIPGMIDLHSHIGRQGSGPPPGAQFRMVDHLDGLDPKWADAVRGGVTTVVTGPAGAGGVGGEAVVVKTAGPTLQGRVLRENGGLKLAAGPRDRESGMSVAAMLRARFLRAREYIDALQRFEADGRVGALPARDPELDAFVRVLRGEEQVRVHVNAAQDIMMMLRLKDEFGFDLALHHAVEAYQVRDEIARRHVDVVTLPLFLRIPVSEEGLANAALLREAGVRVAFHQDDPVSATKWLRFNGALAMRHGMSEADALRGLTIDAASIARVADRVGSIEVGKDADLVVLNGPWYELTTRVELVMVDGVVVYQRSSERE